MKVISERFGIEKSTVSKVIKGFKEKGRMFKLLPTHSKTFILKDRLQSQQAQRLYRKYRHGVNNQGRTDDAPNEKTTGSQSMQSDAQKIFRVEPAKG